jgi:hypothetical protein
MRFAYADPPYLGCGKLYVQQHGEARAWDDPQNHFDLIDRLFDEYPDGWVLSCHEPSLHTLRNYAGRDCRTGIWVKPFASFKPNVNPAYAWEPVIFRGGRKFSRKDATVRDWVAGNITLKRGLTGAKPREFCRWVFSLLNAKKGDEMDDLFPGTGAVGAAWAEWIGAQSPLPHLPLEERMS